MTVLGQHTINETQKLIDDKDADIEDFVKKRTSLPQAPDATWDSDLSALQSRYMDAKAAFDAESAAVIATAGGASGGLSGLLSAVTGTDQGNILTTETSYQGILSALNNGGPEGSTTPGGFQDLASRLLNVPGVTVDESNLPDPNQGVTDVDLKVYQGTGQILKGIGLPTSGLPSWFFPALIGVGAVAVFGMVVVPLVTPLLIARKLA